MQFWLRVAADNYIALEGVSVDGVFGSATRQAVLSFQDYFSLTADGVVGLQTWNKLYTVFLAVANNLLGPNEKPGDFPGTLREGSAGTAVRELQYYLYLLGTYYSGLSPVTVDGIFGSQGLMLSSIYLTPQRIAMWTVGLGFFTKGSKQKLRKKVLGFLSVIQKLLAQD